MKKILFSAFLLFTSASIITAQTVDEIIDKHILALGGKEKLKAIKSMRMTIKGQAQGFEFPVEMLSKKNGCVKTTTTIQNMKMVQCYDANAKAGWFTSPMMGDKKAQKMNEEQTKQVQDQGSKMESELLDYKEKGHTAEYLGKEDMDGDEVYLIKLNKKNGDISYYYIDVLTNLILKEKTKTKTKDKELEGETYYSNYQVVDGITYPASIESMNDGVLAFQISVEKVEYNIEIDDSVFKMPGTEVIQEQNKEK
ncbi:MAG: hypothetical protein ACXVC2_11605 [Bacteroidia bacterium]